MKYDSRKDTKKHINRVGELVSFCVSELNHRAILHDDSKLKSPEKEIFDGMVPKLKSLTYGSDEYKESLKELGVALTHHYKNNTHHPEHFDNGINDMDLFQIMEMLMDWIAATERHANGDIHKSLKINKERFLMSEQLYDILINTVNRFNHNHSYIIK